MSITREVLVSHLNYDESTGVFTLKNTAPGKLSGRYQQGKKVGWNMKNGYVGISINGQQAYAHRLAWLYVNGSYPEDVIDHINGVRTDNRIGNLRGTSQKINSQNLKKSHIDSTTGVLGVTYNKSEGKFITQITSGSKKITRRFKSIEDAGLFYVEKKREMHSGCTL